ncbi:hypothetical protein ABBQ32_011289 [Trebouxia sp. C0010 RCD-2024]
MPTTPFFASVHWYRQRLLQPCMQGRTVVCAVNKRCWKTAYTAGAVLFRHRQRVHCLFPDQGSGIEFTHEPVLHPEVLPKAEEVAGLHILELEGSHLTQLRAGAQPQIPADSFQQLISQSKAAEVLQEQVDELSKQLLEKERESASSHATAMAEQASSCDEQLASMQRRCTQDLQNLQAQHDLDMAAQRSAVQQEVEQSTSKLRQEAATHAATTQELEGLKGQIAELLSSQFASPDEVQAADDGEGDGLDRLRQVLQQSVNTAADVEKTKEQLLEVQQQLAAAHHEAARLHEEHQVTLDQLKNKNKLLVKEQSIASR